MKAKQYAGKKIKLKSNKNVRTNQSNWQQKVHQRISNSLEHPRSKRRMSSNAQVGMPESRSTGEDVEPDLKLRSLWAWVHLCSDYNSAVRANCACSMDDAALLADSLQYEANMAETRAVLVEELKRWGGGRWTFEGGFWIDTDYTRAQS